MNLPNFGLDSITLAAPLAARLAACRAAGFSQIMLWARDLAEHPGGIEEAVRVVRDSGLREYLQPCQRRTRTDRPRPGQAGNSAVPPGIRIGYEAQSWGRHVHAWEQAWEVVDMAAHANLGVVLDSFHMLAGDDDLEGLEDLPSEKIALVQPSDFMLRELRSLEERIETAGHLRVFPGEGSHSAELSRMLRRIDRAGYRGSYSLEVVNDDYLQLSPGLVCGRALNAAKWITDQVLRRNLQVRAYAGRTL